MVAARLAEVGRSDQTALVTDQPDFNAFRGFAAAVNAIIEASQARSSMNEGMYVFLTRHVFKQKIGCANSQWFENYFNL